MKNYNQEIEDLLTVGRNIPEAEFDKYLDSYFTDKYAVTSPPTPAATVPH